MKRNFQSNECENVTIIIQNGIPSTDENKSRTDANILMDLLPSKHTLKSARFLFVNSRQKILRLCLYVAGRLAA
jgi:hypothetical protein